MTGEVIKSFLVGLGFEVDDSSLDKFNKAIATATLRVTGLAVAITASAAAVVKGISTISEEFEQMGYEYRIIAPAINKAIVLRRELLKAYSAAGINITKTVLASYKLNLSLTKTRFALDAIYKSVGSRFFGYLTKQSDLFRQKIYANLPKIMNILEGVVKFIFRALDAVTTLGGRLWSMLSRVYDFFVILDKATDGWSTKVLALVAAWRLLNLSFIATPLGALITSLVTILALYDDFKTYEQGGTSFFNWGPYVPTLKQVGKILDGIWEVIKGIGHFFIDIPFHPEKLVLDLEKVAKGFTTINDAIDKLVKSTGFGALNRLLEFRDKADSSFFNLFKASPTVPTAPPVGSGVQNSQTNQHVSQQTNISVTGTADASAVGKAVLSGQDRVNFDMYRNFKTAVV